MYSKKQWFLVFIIILCICSQSFASDEKEQAVEKADLEKQISYALGYDIVDRLRENFELDSKFFMMGARDSNVKQAKLTPEKIRQLLVSYQRIARQKQIEKIKMESRKNRDMGKKFLEKNKKKKGVVTLPSGLQYEVLTEGDGPFPKATDTIECNYRGTLIDGTVFDSSYQRGKPASFQVNGVIQGWIEALQKMRVGSKWILYVPPELAYGDRGAGSVIKPGATLIFEVEVLGILE
ncbi:MAG: FKBP-type peptidyl-prolyl cis-trans isomerase [Deltaproteobacteria bacterium]|nr:FKBP-type peptidyl-prolyl cis-trans isomerase [Deltaproteobacteria bacterium]